jgi:hypothetical protein
VWFQCGGWGQEDRVHADLLPVVRAPRAEGTGNARLRSASVMGGGGGHDKVVADRAAGRVRY